MSDLHTPSSTGLSANVAGALAYALGGTDFHYENLIAQVEKATGKKATTQSAGLLDGLRTVNA